MRSWPVRRQPVPGLLSEWRYQGNTLIELRDQTPDSAECRLAHASNFI